MNAVSTTPRRCSHCPTSATSSDTIATWSGLDASRTVSKSHYRIIRWYDPVTARWLSNDPIGISGGLNQYVFCGNNPVNSRDPSGLAYDIIGIGADGLAIYGPERDWGDYDANWGGRRARPQPLPINNWLDATMHHMVWVGAPAVIGERLQARIISEQRRRPLPRTRPGECGVDSYFDNNSWI